MIREVLPISGWVRVRHFRGGELLSEQQGKNRVVTVGKQLVASIMAVSPGPARPGWMALGDDDTPVADDQTALQNETTRDALSGSVASGNEVILSCTRTAVGTETVRECGMFNAGAGGTMLCRFVIQEVTLAVNDQLIVDWTLNYGGA